MLIYIFLSFYQHCNVGFEEPKSDTQNSMGLPEIREIIGPLKWFGKGCIVWRRKYTNIVQATENGGEWGKEWHSMWRKKGALCGIKMVYF